MKRVEQCYDNCEAVNDTIYPQINRPKVEYRIAIFVVRDEIRAQIKEDARIKREAIAEATKIAEQKKLEEERKIREQQEAIAKAKAEAEEAERLRLVKLDEEREKRREEKKNTQVAVSRGSGSYGNWIYFEATHYAADCYGCSGITAYGINARNSIYHNGMRVIAVDPNVIPLGTTVQVKTPHQTFNAIAGDTGGRINGHIIDILVENESVARSLGRYMVQVRVIK